MKCPKCRKNVDLNQTFGGMFCPSCGTRLKSTISKEKSYFFALNKLWNMQKKFMEEVARRSRELYEEPTKEHLFLKISIIISFVLLIQLGAYSVYNFLSGPQENIVTKNIVFKAFEKENLPEDARKHLEHGLLQLKNKEVDNAIKSFEESVRLYPQNISARMNLGFIYNGHKRNLDKAIFYYKEILKIDPENFGAIYNLGIIHDQKGNYEEAAHYYEKGLEIRIDDKYTYLYLIKDYLRLDRRKEAKETLEAAMIYYPDDMEFTAFKNAL